MVDSKIWYSIDYLSLILAIALAAMGIVSLCGATLGNETMSHWVRQIIFVVVGFIFIIGLIFLDYRFLIRHAILIYMIGIVGLLLCFVPFLNHHVKGATSWIKLPGFPQIQPSEFAKITTIILLARFLGNRKGQWNGLLDVLRPLIIGAFPAILILKQPDLGTAIVFGPVTLLMMFVAGMPISYLLLLLSPLLCMFGIFDDILYIMVWFGLISGLLLMAVIKRVPWTITAPCLTVAVAAYLGVFVYGQEVWEKVPPHAKNRLVGYLYPDTDLKKTNYNIWQSKVALGSGGFWGKGFGNGTQSKLEFLPEFQHDFIFPVVGEQFGFVGGLSLLAVFLLLMTRGLDTAVASKTMQGSLIAVGVVALFFSHIIINVGMVTGLLPVTGLPLTFISYGGSFMISSMIAVGLIMNVRMRSITETVEERFHTNRPQMVLPTRISDDF